MPCNSDKPVDPGHPSPSSASQFHPKLFDPAWESELAAHELPADDALEGSSLSFAAEDESQLELPPELTALAEQLFDDARHLQACYAPAEPALIAALGAMPATAEPAVVLRPAAKQASPKQSVYRQSLAAFVVGTTALLLLGLALQSLQSPRNPLDSATVEPSTSTSSTVNSTDLAVADKQPHQRGDELPKNRTLNEQEVSNLLALPQNNPHQLPLEPWWELSTPELEAWLDLADDSGEVASISF